MIPYRAIALPPETADEVRSTSRAPGYGHPAFRETANGYGPCRQCLRTFDEGAERRIGFTHDAFSGIEDLPLPGPIFIHESPCESFHSDAGFPEDLRRLPLTFHAYGRGRLPRVHEHVTGGDPEPVIDRLLKRSDVDYIQVHNKEAGCYIFRIEKMGNDV